MAKNWMKLSLRFIALAINDNGFLGFRPGDAEEEEDAIAVTEKFVQIQSAADFFRKSNSLNPEIMTH